MTTCHSAPISTPSKHRLIDRDGSTIPRARRCLAIDLTQTRTMATIRPRKEGNAYGAQQVRPHGRCRRPADVPNLPLNPPAAARSGPLLGNAFPLGIPAPVWTTVICFVVFGWLLHATTFGRNTLAVGGNKEAAFLAGIAAERVKIIIFAMQGLIAALAGIVLASRFTSGQPMSSQGFELEVISACVLGGVSLTGGVGSVGFVVAGVLIMGIVQNAMNLLNVAPFYQYVARGLILLGAVIFDRFKTARQA